MSTNQPSRPAQQSATSGVDDLLLDDLVIQTLEAERFERAAFAEPTPLRLVGSAGALGRRMQAVMRIGSLAAAAALAVGAFVIFSKPGNPSVQPSPTPALGGGGIAGKTTPRPAPAPADHGANPQDQPIVLAASTDDVSLANFAHLDPDLLDGLPTLSGERSLLVAVYRGVEPAASNCDCLTWSVEDPQAAASKPELLASALGTPCGSASREVTLVSITGPRAMLPFHDDDARELVRCIADIANESDTDPCVTDDLCEATLASLCLPAELSVRTLSVRLGE